MDVYRQENCYGADVHAANVFGIVFAAKLSQRSCTLYWIVHFYYRWYLSDVDTL